MCAGVESSSCCFPSKLVSYWVLTNDMWHVLLQSENVFELGDITILIIHSKYFPLSDWLKPHALFTITICCWPNLKRSFAILNQWLQKCNPLQIIETLTEKTWGRDCVIFGERINRERNGETPLRTGKYFEWIIKQLLNSAFEVYTEFCRSRRVLSTSAFGFCA